MQVDDPPYLSVGTAVSAKYKGAFCEAKVSKVVRVVKCKVTYKMGLGAATVSDEQIKGTLRVGQLVQAKHPERKEFVEATITKIQDCSQYTVVFDDGDITTLRRTALCLKSGRHFNESETLDQLPLTHPEHFGNPVVGGRRGRRNRQLKDDSSDGEPEEETEPDLEGYTVDIGRVVSIEATDKKRGKDNWFPGLVVIPSAQPTVRINVKDEYLVRSFKDGRYYTVPKKEVSEFTRELGNKVESSVLGEAVSKAVKYLDDNELPVHWERSSLFNSQSLDSDSEENFSDSSDDEPSEEKDLFVAQLYKFLDDAGTPLNKTPSINGKDIDLHRLFRLVHKMGGGNRVNNKNKWRIITLRMKLPSNQNTFNQVKNVYKKCLSSYETFHRTLGVTMLNHTRSTKKNRGRSLIRDKDRNTPVNSPRPEKDDEDEKPIKKEEPKEEKPVVVEPTPSVSKAKKRIEIKKEEEKKKKEIISETSDTNSSGEATDQSESVAPTTKPAVGRPKSSRERKIKLASGEKVKALVEKFEEVTKKDDEDKVQQTRSKSLSKSKEAPVTPEKKTVESKKETIPPKPPKLQPKKIIVEEKKEEEKKRGRKRTTDEKVSVVDVTPETVPTVPAVIAVNINDKLKVYYGPTHESKVTYEAKVIQINKDLNGVSYLVHYTGWNTRYDEWINPSRIAENLSASNKAKRLKANQSSAQRNAPPPKVAAKRVGRGTSLSSRNVNPDPPVRSTTPSSVTSTSSRTKSPATPATRSASKLKSKREFSKRTRKVSSQTESDSDASESETEELTRTRSGAAKIEEPEVKEVKETKPEKTEKPEIRTYKRKIIPKTATATKTDNKKKEKEDEDTEKEDENETVSKRTRKMKKSPEKSEKSERSTEESDDEVIVINPPKGRDFDLNQIRSELKGFSKVNKLASVPSTAVIEISDKEAVSSSDDSTLPLPEKLTVEDDKNEKAKEKPVETSSSSDDIYEFKEPEPFEFESRSKLIDEKNTKKRVPRIFEELERSPPPKKKVIKSPVKEKSKSPEVEKKRFQRTPLRKQEEPPEETKKEADPFDCLVQSPSFNLVKTAEKVPENKDKVTRNIMEDRLGLFNETSDPVDDFTQGDLDVSDGETQNIFSKITDNIFSDPFSKSSPEGNTLDMEFSKNDESKKDSDDDDIIRQQLQLLIAQGSSTDDDNSSEFTITPSTLSYQGKKKDFPTDPKTLGSILGIESPTTSTSIGNKLLDFQEKIVPPEKVEIIEREPSPMEIEPPLKGQKPIVEQSVFSMISQASSSASKSPPVQISPALQETDSSLLESITATTPILVKSTTLEDTLDVNVKKTGTKIADSILQKFISIKKMESKSPKRDEEKSDTKKDAKADTKKEAKIETVSEGKLVKMELKKKPTADLNKILPVLESKPKPEAKPAKIPIVDVKSPKPEVKSAKIDVKTPKPDAKVDVKSPKTDNKTQKIEIKTTKASVPQKVDVKTIKIDIKTPKVDVKSPKLDDKSPKVEAKTSKVDVKSPKSIILDAKQILKATEIKAKSPPSSTMEVKLKTIEPVKSKMQAEPKKPPSPVPLASKYEGIKRKKVLSRQYIDDSDSDSSDSEKMAIDEDSQSSLDAKDVNKDSDISQIPSTDDSQSQEEEPRNFNFDIISQKIESPKVIEEELEIKDEVLDLKDEEPDSTLHSLLLCEETIPRSPAPATDGNEPKPSKQSVLEMPFASAPGTSSSNTCQSNSKNIVTDQQQETKPAGKHQPNPALALNIGAPPMDRDIKDRISASAVLDNTPPTTPESTISNLSPRGENGDLSPNAADNESCKSNDDGYPLQRSKMATFSEDDSQMSIGCKKRDDSYPGSLKKRRRSCRTDDSSTSMPPAKRGRKPLNRSRHNSDSDDTSEHSTTGSTNVGTYDRANRSPRPSKYNFFVEFDPSLDSTQRIAVLQQKLSELRKTYADVKAELATVERRRKKIRRREREALKASKQEMACA